LEVGCAFGFLIDYLKNNSNAKVQGLDYSKFAITKANPSIRNCIKRGSVVNQKLFKRHKFNAIICFDVFNYLTMTETLIASRNLAQWTNDYLFFGALYKHSAQSSQELNPDKLRLTTLTQKKYISIFNRNKMRYVDKFNVASTGDILVFKKKSN